MEGHGPNRTVKTLGKAFTTLCLRRIESRKFSNQSLEHSNGRCPRDVFIAHPLWHVAHYYIIKKACLRCLLGDLHIHIGVDSDVVCSTLIGNARASMRGMDSKTISRFFYVRRFLVYYDKMTKLNQAYKPLLKDHIADNCPRRDIIALRQE